MTLAWILPDTGWQPIQQVGFVMSTEAPRAGGCVHVAYLRHDGLPALRLRRPDEPGDFWRQAWVNGVSFFSKNFPAAFRISHSVGEGIIIHGTRDWRDYTVTSEVILHLAREGLVFRVQGLRRYYALVLARDSFVRLVKQCDNVRTVLAERSFGWALECPYAPRVALDGSEIRCAVHGMAVFAARDEIDPFETGGIALLINEGALSISKIAVDAVEAPNAFV